MNAITVTNLRRDMYTHPGSKADGSEDKVQPKRRLYDVDIVMAAIKAAVMPNGMFAAHHVQGAVIEWTPVWRGNVRPKTETAVPEVWISEVEIAVNQNAGGEYQRVAVRTSNSSADQVFLERVGVDADSPFRLATGDGFVRVLPWAMAPEFEPRMRPVQREQAADIVELVMPFPGHEAEERTADNSYRLLVPAQGDARFAEIIDCAELKRRGELL